MSDTSAASQLQVRPVDGRINTMVEDLPGQPFQEALATDLDLPLRYLPLRDSAFDLVGDTDALIVGRASALEIERALPGGYSRGDSSALSAGGFVIEPSRVGEHSRLVIVGGDIAGTLYGIAHVGERVNRSSEDEGVEFVLGPHFENPAFPIRAYWTWDHSTIWDLDAVGGVDWGYDNRYLRTSDSFIRDYQRLIDYCRVARVNAVIIWGLLRDDHGGAPSAQAVCRYAADRGVRVLAGVGTSHYGGIYYEGDHPFNVGTWLRRHPESRAMDAQGRLVDRLCPRHPTNRQWLADGATWLARAFDLGGVNLEIGDFMVCHCDRCMAARSSSPSENEFFSDMTASAEPFIAAFKQERPDALITYATYTGFARGAPTSTGRADVVGIYPNMGVEDPPFVTAFPDDAVAQWTLSGMLNPTELPLVAWLDEGRPSEMLRSPDWPPSLRPPTTRSIGLMHQGSQWWSTSKDPEWRSGRYELALSSLKEGILRSAEAGLDGVVVNYGEVSPRYVPAELRHRAFAFFCYNPAASLREFATSLAPLLGGEEAASTYIEILARKLGGEDVASDHAAIDEALSVRKERVADGHGYPEYRRWRYLACIGTPQELDPVH